MELFILRHGKAESSNPDGDAARQLTRKGAAEIQELSNWLIGNALTFDHIATSPLKRAFQTAEIVARESGQAPDLWEELAPGSGFQRMMQRLRTWSDMDRILIVGHEPSLSDCIGRIIVGDPGARIQLKKGGLARIENFSPDDPVSGELSWLLAPRHMIFR